MKIKTSELTDQALDWAVAKAQGLLTGQPGGVYVMSLQRGGYGPVWIDTEKEYRPSRYGKLGKSIYKSQDIKWIWNGNGAKYRWMATRSFSDPYDKQMYGPTPTTAALRYFVWMQLGDEVDVPDELLGEKDQ